MASSSSRRLHITRDQLVAALRAGKVDALVGTALRDIGLDDCSDRAEQLKKRIKALAPKVLSR